MTDTNLNGDLPPAVETEAERLTRLAREAVDGNEATAYRDRRDSLLADYEYTARVREDASRDVLVLHPEEWLDEEGLIEMEQVENLDRGIERPLSGPGESDDWETVAEHNREVVARVEADHGEVHGENAEAFATFMNNHYARAIESATDEEITEFLTEYFPRNVWPSEQQKKSVEQSVELAIDAGTAISDTAE